MEGRDKQKDLFALADEFYEHLKRDDVHYGGWGIDGKRPFGFGGTARIRADIAEFIEMPPDRWDEHFREYELSSDQEAYADELYDELGSFLREQWATYRTQLEQMNENPDL